MVGTFNDPSMWFGVVFLLCFDYLAMSCFYWWLRVRTLRGYRTRAQVSYIAVVLSILSFLLLVVAVIGAVLDRWLLSLEVSHESFLVLRDVNPDSSSCRFQSSYSPHYFCSFLAKWPIVALRMLECASEC